MSKSQQKTALLMKRPQILSQYKNWDQHTPIGIFYFYDILLLIFGIFLPDAAIFVLFQAVFFWIGSLLDAIFHGFVWNDAEEILTKEATFRNELKGQALRSFVDVIPSLLVIPDGFMALLLYIGCYVDEFGLWYGTTIVEAFCFGLIIPLIIPTVILIHSFRVYQSFRFSFAFCTVHQWNCLYSNLI